MDDPCTGSYPKAQAFRRRGIDKGNPSLRVRLIQLTLSYLNLSYMKLSYLMFIFREVFFQAECEYKDVEDYVF